MKTNKPTTEFLTVPTIVNVLALIYPINLLLRANGVDDLFATCVLVGSLFLLVVVDALSIAVADAFGAGKYC
jgi:hypothetical protein